MFMIARLVVMGWSGALNGGLETIRWQKSQPEQVKPIWPNAPVESTEKEDW